MTEDQTARVSRDAAPDAWAVVLGWNHAEDTLECLATLRECRDIRPRLLYVDNGSREEEVRRVLEEAPDVEVIRHERNVGVSRGFNGGLAWALRKGAGFVFMANNDTAAAPDSLRLLYEAAARNPKAGILVPKIYYYNNPDVLWSAGSRFRRFPPAIVMNKTAGADDGRFDAVRHLEFSTLCTVLVRAEAFKAAGLMDPNFLYYFEDYEFCLRVRQAGYSIELVPEAGTRHKVERVTRASSSSPAFWETSGRSAAVFSRRHAARHPWTAGRAMLGYLVLRALHDGGWNGMKHFARGLREGRAMHLNPVPAWNDPSPDAVIPLREIHMHGDGHAF